eukprot:GHVH01006141.1.p1 GENE.GHVH01006141.1~~GHVH01006141.1.p1  ORF type:complete len:975 (-),score=142.85 GHVH01006141.1:138-3062(-)
MQSALHPISHPMSPMMAHLPVSTGGGLTHPSHPPGAPSGAAPPSFYMDAARRFQSMMVQTPMHMNLPQAGQMAYHSGASLPNGGMRFRPPQNPHLIHGIMRNVDHGGGSMISSGANGRSCGLKCPPSQTRNGRPSLTELLSMCNNIYASYNIAEKPIQPATPLKLSSIHRKIFCRAASIRTQPFETISPVYRLLGFQSVKWLPSRIGYPRENPNKEEDDVAASGLLKSPPSQQDRSNETLTTPASSPEFVMYPSFAPPTIGRASFLVPGPVQIPESPKNPGHPADPTDERWKRPLWSFYSHLTHMDARPVALSLICFMDDLTFIRLRGTSQESRKWLDYWYTAWVSEQFLPAYMKPSPAGHRILPTFDVENFKSHQDEHEPPVQVPRHVSNSLAHCLLFSHTYRERTPWLKLDDLELFESIRSVGGSKATQSSYVQQFRAPNPNFVRMCIATMEPGGVFSMIPLDLGVVSSNSGSDSSLSSSSAADNSSSSSLHPSLLLSDTSIDPLRRNESLFPDLTIDYSNRWHVWYPSTAAGEFCVRLYNCWRMNVARVISVHRRKVFHVWSQHDMIHFNRAVELNDNEDDHEKQHPIHSLDSLSTTDTVSQQHNPSLKGSKKQSATDKHDDSITDEGACCYNPNIESSFGRTWIDWFASSPEDSSAHPSENLFINARNHSNSNAAAAAVNNSFSSTNGSVAGGATVAGASPAGPMGGGGGGAHNFSPMMITNTNRRAESRRRTDRRTETDMKRNTLTSALDNLFKHLTDDLQAPYLRPGSSASEQKKDPIVQSLLANQQRIEWDLVCLLAVYAYTLEKSGSSIRPPVLDKLEKMIRNLKIDRFMVLILQCRMNKVKNCIKDSFDPSLRTIDEVLSGSTFRPRTSSTTTTSSSSNGDSTANMLFGRADGAGALDGDTSFDSKPNSVTRKRYLECSSSGGGGGSGTESKQRSSLSLRAWAMRKHKTSKLPKEPMYKKRKEQA